MSCNTVWELDWVKGELEMTGTNPTIELLGDLTERPAELQHRMESGVRMRV